MTIDEFVVKLEEKVKAGCTFELRNGRIRRGVCCPLEVVGDTYGFINCANLLGVSNDDANQIATAADYPLINDIRAKLLEACGLEETCSS